MDKTIRIICIVLGVLGIALVSTALMNGAALSSSLARYDDDDPNCDTSAAVVSLAVANRCVDALAVCVDALETCEAQ